MESRGHPDVLPGIMDKMRDSLEATKRYELKNAREKLSKLSEKLARQTVALNKMTNALIKSERVLQKVLLDNGIELEEKPSSIRDVLSTEGALDESHSSALSEMANMQEQIKSVHERLSDAKTQTSAMLERVNLVEADNQRLKGLYIRLKVKIELVLN